MPLPPKPKGGVGATLPSRSANRAEQGDANERFFASTSLRIRSEMIAVDLIDLDPDNPRSGELPDIDKLKASIRKKGLLQPIGVVRDEDGGYICKFGNRRLQAFKELATEDQRYASIPATVITDGNGLEEAILSNTQIAQLSQADRARAFQRLHDLGYKDEEIGQLFNLSRQSVNTLRNNVERLDAGETFRGLTHQKVSDSPTSNEPKGTPSNPHRVLAQVLTFANRQKMRVALKRGKYIMSDEERADLKAKALQVREAMDDQLEEALWLGYRLPADRLTRVVGEDFNPEADRVEQHTPEQRAPVCIL